MSVRDYVEDEKLESFEISSEIKNFNDLQNLVDFTKNYLKNKKISQIIANIKISYYKRS